MSRVSEKRETQRQENDLATKKQAKADSHKNKVAFSALMSHKTKKSPPKGDASALSGTSKLGHQKTDRDSALHAHRGIANLDFAQRLERHGQKNLNTTQTQHHERHSAMGDMRKENEKLGQGTI